MSEFSDRRKEPRKKVMTFTPVYGLEKGILLGYLRDLTFQGALVIGGKQLEVDSLVTLSIKIPDALPNIPGNRLSISARVARCIEDESPGSYKLGFEFINIQPDQNEVIKAILDRYHFRYKTY